MEKKNLTVRYALIQTVFWICGCCVLTYTTPLLQWRGFTNTEIGITLAAASCLAIAVQPLVAAFADRTKKISLNRLIVLMMVLLAVLSLISALVPGVFWATAGLSVVISMLVRMQNSLLVSLSSEQIQSGGRLNFSLARGIGSASYAIAALIIGYVVDKASPEVILPINIVGAVLTAGMILLFPKPEVSAAKTEKAEEKPSSLLGFIRENKRFMATSVCFMLIYLSHVFINSFTIQIVTSRNGSSAEMGIASAIGGFVELPAMAMVPFLLKKLKRASSLLKIGTVAMVVKALVTLFSPNLGWFYAAQSLQSCAYALLLPGCVYYVNRMIPGKDKVKGQSLLDTSIVVTSVAGSVLGGIFLDMKSVDFMMTVGTVVSAIGAVLLFFVIEDDKAEE